MQRFKVSPVQANGRLDLYLAERMPQLSRSSIKKLVEDRAVLVNGESVKSGHIVRADDRIEVNFDLRSLTEIPQIDLPILYEDDDVIVINKPTGVLTHSKGVFNPEATVATFVAPKLHGMSGDRAGIVHRLDRATSGVIIGAKNPEALHWLQKQFSTRKVKKTYIAVVEGTINPAEAVIDMPIARNPRKPKTFYVNSAGKPAVTRYKVLETGQTLTMLELYPETGRTHQLRVHLKHLRHPIVGDELYGGLPNERLLLHALSLEITLPNRKRQKFVAPLPEAFHNSLHE